MQTMILTATNAAKEHKKKYIGLASRVLGVNPSVTLDLYRLGAIPNAFPVPAIPLEVEVYPDPLIVIIATFPVDDKGLNECRYWKAVWRSDGDKYL